MWMGHMWSQVAANEEGRSDGSGAEDGSGDQRGERKNALCLSSNSERTRSAEKGVRANQEGGF